MSIQNVAQFSNVSHSFVRLYTSRYKKELANSLDALPEPFRLQILEEIRKLAGSPIRPDLGEIFSLENLPRLHEAVYLVVSKNFSSLEQDRKDVVIGNSDWIETIGYYPCEKELANLIKQGPSHEKLIKRRICLFCKRYESISDSDMRKIFRSASERIRLEGNRNSLDEQHLAKKIQFIELTFEVLFSFPKEERSLVQELFIDLESQSPREGELGSNLKKIISKILMSRPVLIENWSNYASSTFPDTKIKPSASQNIGVMVQETKSFIAQGSEAFTIEIAKICAEENASTTAECIQSFGIKSQEDLIKIALTCAEKDPYSTAECIQSFAIKSQEDLIKIALICAEKDPYSTAECIQSFGIKSQEDLIRIAMLCAQKNGEATAQCIQKFGIQSQQALIQIAIICAQQKSGWKTAEYIQDFGIQSQQALIQISRHCIEQDGGWRTAKYIQNLGIRSQKALIKIAIMCAQQDDGWETSKHIYKFGIQSQQALIKIAMLCAQKKRGWKTAKYIRNFGIQSQQVLVKIARYCIQQDKGWKIAEYVKNFEIQSQEALIEIAMICVQKPGSLEIAEHIHNFGIKDQSILIKMAKHCIQQCDGWKTAKWIENFGIQDKGVLIEMARYCIHQDYGWLTAKWIENFGIQDKGVLIEMAKNCIQQEDGWETAKWIEKFGIQDERILIEMAVLCSEENNEHAELAKYIHNFGIKSKEALIQIAIRCAEQNGGATAEHIKNFDIQEKNALIEIAIRCAEQNGEKTAEHIENFHIQDQQAIFDIRSACLFELYASRSIEDFNGYAKMILAPYRKDFLPLNIGNPFERTEKRTDRDNRDQAQLFFLYLHQKQHFLKHKKELTVEQKDVFIQASKYRNRTIAAQLGFSFQRILSDQQALNNYLDACRIQLNKAPLTYLRLPLLILSQWSSNPEDMKPIRELIQLYKKEFKDAGNRILQAWLLTSLTLNRSSLSSSRKLKLFQQACTSLERTNPLDDLFLRLSTICALIDLGQQDQYDRDFSEGMTQELSALLENALKSGYPFLEKLDGISSEKYLNTLGSMRVPLGWVTYLRTISSLKDPEVEQEVEEMFSSIIQGTYLTERARTDKSPHLQVIANHHPELFKAWQIPPCSEPYTPAIEEVASHSFDFKNFLAERFRNHHFRGAEDVFSPLGEFLESGLQRTEGDHEAVKICMALCLNTQGIEEQLEQLQCALREVPMTEFHRDIEDLLKSLRENKKEDALEIGDTNHWLDLFLSGSDVLGSCQRIDGSPRFNKCLTGYVMDAKTRMIFLRDSRSGKLLARAIFKLLLTEKDHQPILFFDKIYPPTCRPEWRDALVGFARKRAKALGCTLVEKNCGFGTEPFSGKIVSLGSRSPYEYEDGTEQMERKGIFTISNDLKIIKWT